ncbi:hypothetical protein BOTBODRAFT_70746 [Botryobasidium botryosum FD-172 SS1]|uniref:GATA-type domain-containing protein n=1 Tax=Botryobasidium botryosum (strain FD-172 SS1) TaxID=930990 RepID=A0A067LX28_BOTB1|nr:hypothetical protein BOTBODRAFT_70746 [Botryobasidium botryosum FD-172 SS1]
MNSTQWRDASVPDGAHLGLGEMYPQYSAAAAISAPGRETAAPQPSGHPSALYEAPSYIPRNTPGVGAELPNRSQSSYFSALPANPNRAYGQQDQLQQYPSPSEQDTFPNHPSSTPAPLMSGRYPNSYMESSQTSPNSQKGKRPAAEQMASSPPMNMTPEYRELSPAMDYEKMAHMYQAIINAVGGQQSPGAAPFSETPHTMDQVLGTAIESLRMFNPSAAERLWQSEMGGAEVGNFASQSSGKGVDVGDDAPEEEGPAKKKKKDGKGGEQKCRSCNTTATPEWRRGPLGPRTLCNACGLVWAKMIKKRTREAVDNTPPFEQDKVHRDPRGPKHGSDGWDSSDADGESDPGSGGRGE